MKTRKGFSLIEIMVALTLLSIVLMSISRMSSIVALRAKGNDKYAKRQAALQLEANKFGAMPIATIAAWNPASHDSMFTVAGFGYKRRVAITAQSSTRYTIKVVVRDTSVVNTAARDSVTIDRTSPPSSTALCTGC
jgi:prepilin-type N-terminal cleavage/methylation domain-containing protein